MLKELPSPSDLPITKMRLSIHISQRFVIISRHCIAIMYIKLEFLKGLNDSKKLTVMWIVFGLRIFYF